MPEGRVHFDDLELVRVMFRLEEQGRLAHVSGVELMTEMGGQPGQDAERQDFVRMLLVAADDGLISFQLSQLANASPPNPHEYRFVADAMNFRLHSKGRDRAIGREIVVGFPDPSRDDGRRLSQRLLADVATAMGAELALHDAPVFLAESGVPRERCPPIADQPDAAAYIYGVLLDLAGRGASGRRVVFRFVGNWLDDELDIAPTDEERRDLIARFARAGWKLEDSTLVLSQKIKTTRAEQAAAPDPRPSNPEKASKVMVVYGRDSVASSAMFDFLRALRLEPQEWISLVRATENAAPYTGEVLDRALEIVQAVVVLFTPADEARLRADLLLADDGPSERDLHGQPRPNVLYEAGLAMGRHPTRTVLVELGALRGVSDLFGRHTVRLGTTADPLHDLAERLRTAGCSVDTSGQHWRDPSRFTLNHAVSARLTEASNAGPRHRVSPASFGSAVMDQLAQTAAVDPARAITEAHRRLYEGLTVLIQHLPDSQLLTTVSAITERAVSEGLITPEAANSIQGLTTMANLNANPRHADDVTPESAIDYLTLVDGVLCMIRQPPLPDARESR